MKPLGMVSQWYISSVLFLGFIWTSLWDRDWPVVPGMYPGRAVLRDASLSWNLKNPCHQRGNIASHISQGNTVCKAITCIILNKWIVEHCWVIKELNKCQLDVYQGEKNIVSTKSFTDHIHSAKSFALNSCLCCKRFQVHWKQTLHCFKYLKFIISI